METFRLFLMTAYWVWMGRKPLFGNITRPLSTAFTQIHWPTARPVTEEICGWFWCDHNRYKWSLRRITNGSTPLVPSVADIEQFNLARIGLSSNAVIQLIGTQIPIWPYSVPIIDNLTGSSAGDTNGITGNYFPDEPNLHCIQFVGADVFRWGFRFHGYSASRA